MKLLLSRLLIRAACVALGLSLSLTARSATAAVPSTWAFAYNDNPSPPPGAVMNPSFQAGSFQTLCPGAVATITQFALGQYAVVLPCTASPNGIVHVTAVNAAARYCEIQQWFDSGADKVVIVLCFKGPAADSSQFTVSYTTSSGVTASGAHGYVYSSPAGVPIASYNSAGGVNTIVHPSVGRWTVSLPSLSAGAYIGDLQATAVHPNNAPRRCKIENWFFTAAGSSVLVMCTDNNGALVDTWFTMSYHAQRSVVATQPTGFAYLTNLVGAPSGTDFNSLAPPNSFSASPPGRYHMQLPSVGGPFGGFGATHMQVTALSGTAGFYCQLEKVWSIDASGKVDAPVICFNNVGTPVDNFQFSTFTSAF
jgi:hypothetical protein